MFGGRHIRATLIRRVRNPTSTTERFRRIRPVVSAPTGRLNVQTMASHPTFGVEEEFLLADPTTGEPVAENKAVAAHAAEHGVKLQLELSSCQVETTSEVVGGSDALRKELTRLRSIAAEAAKANGAQLLAAALPPTRQLGGVPQRGYRVRQLAQHRVGAMAQRGSAIAFRLRRLVCRDGADVAARR